MANTNRQNLKRLVVIIASCLASLLVLSGGGWYWWMGTPEYSMSQLKTAFQQHDVDRAFRYIDYDKVFDNLWSDITAKAMTDATSSTSSGDGLQAFGTMLGVSFLESMKPVMKGAFRTGLENAIKGEEASDTATSSHEFVQKLEAKNLKIRRNGSEASVDLDNGMSLILDQTPDRSWKITRIEGIDTSSTAK